MVRLKIITVNCLSASYIHDKGCACPKKLALKCFFFDGLRCSFLDRYQSHIYWKVVIDLKEGMEY
jgi:hypothetical protein